MTGVLQSIVKSYKEIDSGIQEHTYGLAKNIAIQESTHSSNTTQTEPYSTYNSNSTYDSKDNCMVVCSKIFEQINKYNYAYTAKTGMLALIDTMVECTGQFILRRVHTEMMQYVLAHYALKTFVVDCTEIATLSMLLYRMSHYSIPVSVYFLLLSCCMSIR